MFYFAYGSNLHPLRLAARVPSAQVIGISRLHGYRFTLTHPSLDGSGKCSIYPVAANDMFVYGVLYAIQNPAEKKTLDEIEGGQFGWHSTEIEVKTEHESIDAFTYLASSCAPEQSAMPYHWYRDIVLLGAQYHGLPGEVIREIRQTGSQHDPDRSRNEANQRLIAQLRATI